METINRLNYERFLIDFADGNLSQEQHAQVVLFLEQNSDIAEEFEGIFDVNLEPPSEHCENINSLKKSILKPLIINNDNYEHYFIAYFEGDLTEEEKSQVYEFIDLNKELEKDFLSFQQIYFNTNNSAIIDKSNLKRITLANGKNILEKEFYNLCIAYHEGDLSKEDIININNTIKISAVAKNIFNSFLNLKLIADENIVFPNKSSLKKKSTLIYSSFTRIGTSVAAAIAILLLFYFNWQTKSNKVTISHTPIHTYNTQQITNTTNKNNENDFQKKKQENSSVADVNISKVTLQKYNHIIKRQKNKLNIINYRSISESLAKRNIIMKPKTINMQERFVTKVDTGYYMVIANTENSIIERTLPLTLKQTLRKVKRMFIRKKELLKAEPPQTTIANIAQYAVNGFNKFTENNYSLNKNILSDNPTSEIKKK